MTALYIWCWNCLTDNIVNQDCESVLMLYTSSCGDVGRRDIFPGHSLIMQAE